MRPTCTLVTSGAPRVRPTRPTSSRQPPARRLVLHQPSPQDSTFTTWRPPPQIWRRHPPTNTFPNGFEPPRPGIRRAEARDAARASAGAPLPPAVHQVTPMPGIEHNAIVAMFRENPALAPHLLTTVFHRDLPPHPPSASPTPASINSSPSSSAPISSSSSSTTKAASSSPSSSKSSATRPSARRTRGPCTARSRVGVVQGPTFPDMPDAPEVDVRWEPSQLRYGYLPEDLAEEPMSRGPLAARRPRE